MACDNRTALTALRRGHVTWQDLHPRVRLRLEMAGYTAARLFPTVGALPGPEPYDRVFEDDHG